MTLVPGTRLARLIGATAQAEIGAIRSNMTNGDARARLAD
jgi:hypothetical protein